MKYSIVLIVFLFSNAFSQTLLNEYLYETNDDQKALKKNRVKKMIVTNEDYEDGKLEDKFISEIFIINENGLIVKYEDLSWQVDFNESWTEFYSYDEKNRLTKVVLEIQGNTPEPEIEETHYAYNSKGKLDSICEFHLEENYLVLDSCEYFFYDDKGRLSYTGNREGLKYDELEYLKNGDILKKRKGRVSTFKNGIAVRREYASSEWQFKYNKQGQLIKSECKATNTKAEFDYDRNGLPLEYRSYKNGQIKWRETYTYEYYDKK